jgi:hypothetical protein
MFWEFCCALPALLAFYELGREKKIAYWLATLKMLPAIRPPDFSL